jgi:hypothetical protein
MEGIEEKSSMTFGLWWNAIGGKRQYHRTINGDNLNTLSDPNWWTKWVLWRDHEALKKNAPERRLDIPALSKIGNCGLNAVIQTNSRQVYQTVLIWVKWVCYRR